MDYSRIDASQIDQLWELQKAYKAEIGEDQPGEQDRSRLVTAIEKGQIAFYGAWDGSRLAGCCSIT
ncbi:MAG: N-acetyltransferase, partial [Oscillospiraceae bacterium]|nr:N-acetyltransferase [Oscillospiraceae bacterium]